MASNKHALIRYRTLDRCFKSQNRDYFMKDLIKECTDSVHEYVEEKTGKTRPYKLISRRTICDDIEFMRSDAGFKAEIIYDRSEGYYYQDRGFEAFKAKMSQSDTEKLGEALAILKQLSGESNFKDLESMVTRLEENYQIKRKRKDKVIVHFENSTNIEGQKWVTPLKEKIRKKSTLWIDYQPFGNNVYKRIISPYFLKEYNNRWFMIGYDHDKKLITNLGLDRIQSIDQSIQEYHVDADFDPSTYAKDIVGVSIPPKPKKIKLKIKAHGRQRFYLDTKPIHSSQIKIKEGADYAIFQLDVIPNFELLAKILSNSNTLEVLSPKSIRDECAKKVKQSYSLYFKK